MVWQKDRMTESQKACLGKPPEGELGSYRLNTEGQQPSLPTVPTGLLTVRELSANKGLCNEQRFSPPTLQQ